MADRIQRTLELCQDHYQHSQRNLHSGHGASEIPWRNLPPFPVVCGPGELRGRRVLLEGAVGETCTVHDYVAPPHILSKEISDKEITWSIGDYIEPETVWSSFQLKSPIPPKIGVSANQPSPFEEQSGKIWKLWTVLFFLLLFLQLIFLLLSQNKLVYQNAFAFHQADVEKARITDVFELTGRPSNVIIESRANVDNSWIYLNLALINEETGNAYDFGREVSYYHGYDGGESWKEGSPSDEAIIPAVPSGHYYLRIEPDAEVREMNYSIRVYRDVPRWTYFFMALGGLF